MQRNGTNNLFPCTNTSETQMLQSVHARRNCHTKNSSRVVVIIRWLKGEAAQTRTVSDDSARNIRKRRTHANSLQSLAKLIVETGLQIFPGRDSNNMLPSKLVVDEKVTERNEFRANRDRAPLDCTTACTGLNGTKEIQLSCPGLVLKKRKTRSTLISAIVSNLKRKTLRDTSDNAPLHFHNSSTVSPGTEATQSSSCG